MRNMEKITSRAESIKIESTEDLKIIEKNLNTRQNIQFVCLSCQQVTERPLYRLQAKDYRLLCRKCSFNESKKQTWENKSEKEKKEIKEKREKTFLEKYGVKNCLANKQIRDKIKQTTLEKYGVESFSQTQQFKDKTKQTWKNKDKEDLNQLRENHEKIIMQKYGVKNALQSDLIREKIKQTNLRKYGTEWQQQTEKGKQDRKNAMLQKYGVENSSQVEEIRKHRKGLYSLDDINFDSKEEICFYIYCRNRNLNITRNTKSFEYFFENKKHYCFPDFEVDGRLYEIKGSQFLKEDKTWQNPFDHTQDDLYEAKRQCLLANGVNIIYSKDCRKYIDYVHSTYSKNYIAQFKR